MSGCRCEARLLCMTQRGGDMQTAHITTDALGAIDEWTELASRENDGLAVSLFWSKATDRIKVLVADTKFDDVFELDVRGRRGARGVPPSLRVRGRPRRVLRRCPERIHRSAAAELKGHQCHPSSTRTSFAARMGRWSANHWKTAVFGWLAFVVASVVPGHAARHQVHRPERRERRRVPHGRSDHRRGRLHRRRQGRERSRSRPRWC